MLADNELELGRRKLRIGFVQPFDELDLFMAKHRFSVDDPFRHLVLLIRVAIEDFMTEQATLKQCPDFIVEAGTTCGLGNLGIWRSEQVVTRACSYCLRDRAGAARAWGLSPPKFTA